MVVPTLNGSGQSDLKEWEPLRLASRASAFRSILVLVIVSICIFELAYHRTSSSTTIVVLPTPQPDALPHLHQLSFQRDSSPVAPCPVVPYPVDSKAPSRGVESAPAEVVEDEAHATLLEMSGYRSNQFPEFELPFRLWDCEQVYFDFGTNEGRQVRRLLLGTHTAGSLWAARFERFFGPFSPQRTQRTCVIGSEPNRALHGKIAALEEQLRQTGARFHIFRNPIWVNNDFLTFHEVHDDSDQEKVSSIANTAQGLGRFDKQGRYSSVDMNFTTYQVRCLRLAGLLHQVNPNATVLMKMDVEGAEHRLLLDLLMTGTICRLNFLGVEIHTHMLPDDVHDLEYISYRSGPRLKREPSLKRLANVLNKSGRCNKTLVTVFDDEA